MVFSNSTNSDDCNAFNFNASETESLENLILTTPDVLSICNTDYKVLYRAILKRELIENIQDIKYQMLDYCTLGSH